MALVLVFAHTADGEDALKALLEAGVEHAELRVIGDIGAPAGASGAERHVTFDALHVPATERALLMDTIRSGGVVLGVVGRPELHDEVRRLAEKYAAVKVFETANGSNPSHNAA